MADAVLLDHHRSLTGKQIYNPSMLTWRVDNPILRDEVTSIGRGVDRHKVLRVVEVFPLEGVEQSITELFLSECQH